MELISAMLGFHGIFDILCSEYLCILSILDGWILRYDRSKLSIIEAQLKIQYDYKNGLWEITF